MCHKASICTRKAGSGVDAQFLADGLCLLSGRDMSDDRRDEII
ncbi:hypothetical protein [Roseinatronobacter sp.]